MSSTCLKDTPQDAAAIVQDAQIVELTQRLAQVTAERDQLRHQDPDRYEERIVELHSVIAELSRKLELGKDDVIPEESEIEEGKSTIFCKNYVKSTYVLLYNTAYFYL